jgi:hypothetical protein
MSASLRTRLPASPPAIRRASPNAPHRAGAAQQKLANEHARVERRYPFERQLLPRTRREIQRLLCTWTGSCCYCGG